MTEKNQITVNKLKEFIAKQLTVRGDNQLARFPYKETELGKQQRHMMNVALLFWEFLRRFSNHVVCLKGDEKMKFIREFLAEDSLVKKNGHIKTICMIEALPTTIWRKLLWRENIDFVNYESCLRRLTPEQKQAIEDNYSDLFSGPEPKTPRVLKKSWRDRVKLFFGITSVKKIMNENRSDRERRASKTAWAFNLLGLDFGFSLYPKGDFDDTKITNQKWTRFLSVKEHINDFSVNKEDGKYFWFYKTATMKHVFNPQAQIEMKKHVCPGFWRTLITHFLFWIISPAALISAGVFIAQEGLHYKAYIALACAFAMIIWLAINMIRYLAMAVEYAYENFLADNKIIKKIFVVLLVAIIGSIILYGLYHVLLFLYSCIVALVPTFGVILAIMIVPSALFYLFFLFFCLLRDNSLFDYDDVPSFVRFLLHLTVGAAVITIIDKFFLHHIVDFVVMVAQSVWQWYTANLLLANWFLLTLGFVGLFARFAYIFLYDEKKFAGLEKTFKWFTRGFSALTIIVFVIALAQANDFGLMNLSMVFTLALCLVIIAFGFSYIMLDQVNKENIEDREKAGEYLSYINRSVDGFAYKNYIARILKSKWLSKMEAREKWNTVNDIRRLANAYFPENYLLSTDFFDLMVAEGSPEMLAFLQGKEYVITAQVENERDLLTAVRLIIGGLSLEKAIAKIEAGKTAVEKAKARLKKTGQMIALPFVASFWGVVWFFTQIGRFFLTLKDVWDLFNKRCPFIAESRYLD